MTPLKNAFLITALSLAATLATPPSIAADPADSMNTLPALKERVTRVHEDTHSTAIGIAVVDRGKLVWVDAIGKANIKQGTPATADTVFQVGSIAKMIVSLSILQLVEDGKLELQASLRELAPEIQHTNPWEAQAPVRLVHLLEHTTGWPDMSYAEYAHRSATPTDLRAALAAYPDSRHSRWMPGTRMAYSNIGPAVAANIVQKTAGMPFEDYARQSVLAPLGMSATSFVKPERQTASPYINGVRQRYQYPLYRPSGPLHTSPRDMGKLLRFFLKRGQTDKGAVPLSPSLIERMETPTTTLANPLGVTAGYGLANRSRGFKRYGIDFHGHDGHVPGAMATFYYAPDLNSGYFLALTGNASGARELADAVRTYLLRDRSGFSKPASTASGNKVTYTGLTGVYRPLNQSVDFMNFVPNFFKAVAVTVEDNTLSSRPIGSARAPRALEADNGLWVDTGSGFPTATKVQDPVAGKALQIGSTLYQKVSPVSLWGEIIFWGLTLSLSVLALLYALVWLPVALFRNTLFRQETLLRLWPTLASLIFLSTLLYPLLSPLDITGITPWSGPATMLFVLTLANGLFSALGVFYQTRLRKIAIGRWQRPFITTLVLLHASMALYLGFHGIIGMRLWTW